MTVGSAAVTRRPIDERDEALLRQLFLEGRPELALLPPGLQEEIVDLQLRAQREHYAAAYPNALDQIITVEGVAVGRLMVSQSVDAVRVVDVAVILSRRGQGIASNVIRGVIADADLLGVPVSLSVWSTNAGARALYARLGFVEAGGGVDEGDGYVELRRAAGSEGA